RHIKIGQLSTSTMGSTTASNALVNLFNIPNLAYTNTIEVASLGGIGQGFTNYTSTIGSTRPYHPQLLSGYSYLSDSDFWMGGRQTETTNWSIVTGGARSATFGPTVNSNLVALYNGGTIYNAAAVTNNSTVLTVGAATFNGIMTNTVIQNHIFTSGATQVHYERTGTATLDFAQSGGWQQWTSTGDNGTLWLGTGIGIFNNVSTISVNKRGGTYSLSYDNTLFPLVAANAFSGGNEIQYGGGSSSYKAATAHRFFAAATTNVVTGTEVLTLTSSKITTSVPTDTYGVIDGSAAAASYVGRVVSALVASGSAGLTVTATGTNVTSISLPAGDWDVEGNVNFNLSVATATAFSAGITTTTLT
ncbi:MAG: hypothetical protein EBR99_08365, partial [Actinobacteria bacterium]|nr:hypothetical protein [Actinomycetota bacterium]